MKYSDGKFGSTCRIIDYSSDEFKLKKTTKHLLLIVISSIFAALLIKLYLYSYSNSEIPIHEKVTIEFPSDTRLSTLTKNLKSQNLITSEILFKILVRTSYNYSKFQAGDYVFNQKVSPHKIITMLLNGKIAPEELVTIAIPEGFTLKQIFKRLAANDLGLEDNFWNLSKDKNFLLQNNIRSNSLEGYLYPATYHFKKSYSEKQIIKHMIKTFYRNLPKGILEELKKVRLTLNEAVTFASLIELETSIAKERSLVSEVIWNRLKKKQPIGIDSAVIYGIKDYDGDITWSHLRDSKNPYNTRIHKGLPPGPICSPAKESLAAVTTPTNMGYFYYVLISGTNKHHFSKSLNEHNRYVRKLVKGINN